MTFHMQERLNLFEIAQETIGFMMAMRTEAIYEEKKKEYPNAEKIDKWNKEFYQLDTELHGLRVNDDAEIKRVLDEYCPLVKANFESGELLR